jgi:glycine/D-amino acid oxidase-like deaminating enzyme
VRSSGQNATRRKDLRSGDPVWLSAGPPRVQGHPLGKSQRYDVIVVGAGISGAMVADALATAGFSVALLDRRHPGLGSTAASTALLQFEIDTPLIELSKKIGKSKAERAWRRSYAAVGDLRRRVRELRIACDFRSRHAVYLPGNILTAKDLEREADARRRIDLPSEYVTGADLKGQLQISKAAAIVSAGSADVNPVKLTAGLLRRAIRSGAKLHFPIEVTDVAPRARGVDVATSTGSELSCRHLVFASGYEFPKDVPMDGHKIISTWAFATRPQPELLWPNRHLIWEAADPYLYLRTTVDGRIVAGGEDQEVDNEKIRDALMQKKIAAISRQLARLLPRVDPRPDFQWAGFFGESSTGLPTIGAIPGMSNCFAVLGYGGNGITFSMIAAQVIRGSICGTGDTDADLYKFP